MPTVARIDRGGPSPNLAREAQRLLRRHGKTWLAELEKLASLGDAQAIKTIAEIARQEPRPTRPQSPTT